MAEAARPGQQEASFRRGVAEIKPFSSVKEGSSGAAVKEIVPQQLLASTEAHRGSADTHRGSFRLTSGAELTVDTKMNGVPGTPPRGAIGLPTGEIPTSLADRALSVKGKEVKGKGGKGLIADRTVLPLEGTHIVQQETDKGPEVNVVYPAVARGLSQELTVPYVSVTEKGVSAGEHVVNTKDVYKTGDDGSSVIRTDIDPTVAAGLHGRAEKIAQDQAALAAGEADVYTIPMPKTSFPKI